MSIVPADIVFAKLNDACAKFAEAFAVVLAKVSILPADIVFAKLNDACAKFVAALVLAAAVLAVFLAVWSIAEPVNAVL